MSKKFLYSILFFIVFILLHESTESKKVVIHVPYKVKNVKHTHTIYKILKPQHHRRELKYDDDDDYDEYDGYRKR
ncbi:uncharacterized protein [Linepithema humile]|uniref:uncharacterized protein n=1 Tax=Linepithema humile TaxID=83485 RepID=UPI00351E369E